MRKSGPSAPWAAWPNASRRGSPSTRRATKPPNRLTCPATSPATCCCHDDPSIGMTDLQTAPDVAPAAGRRMRSGLTSDEIRALLPHEWPFLFLDRVTEVRPPDRATGLKNVAISEPYFAGHFRQQS